MTADMNIRRALLRFTRQVAEANGLAYDEKGFAEVLSYCEDHFGHFSDMAEARLHPRLFAPATQMLPGVAVAAIAATFVEMHREGDTHTGDAALDALSDLVEAARCQVSMTVRGDKPTN